MRKVVYAKLHTNLFIPGIKSFNDTLAANEPSFPLTLTYDALGIHWVSKNGIKRNGLVPVGNVASVEFEIEVFPKVVT